MNPRLLRIAYLIVFLILLNVFAALVGGTGMTALIAPPLLAGITTVGISYGVRAVLVRRNR